MASKPGILTDWPWTPLGNFKYWILAPGVIHSIYQYVVKDEQERDLSYLLIFPFLLWRMIHGQIWISLSRYRTATGVTRIVDKGVEFDQVDRERNWDDPIVLNGVLFYIGTNAMAKASHLPLWRTDGVVIIFLLHMGPVEFLYYWLHRALHHHYLYSRYHSHHHSSIVTEPNTYLIHPFAENLVYYVLNIAVPLLALVLSGTASVAAYCVYITYIDFMNFIGHCNFELIPLQLFSLFPPLKFLIYTSSYHSLHHTQVRTNYSLFMPLYDYVYGTMDKSTDALYKTSLKREEETADVVHLTHITTSESIYHLRLGFTGLASNPYTSTSYLRFLSPFTMWFKLFLGFCGQTFVVERNQFEKLKIQTWTVPMYKMQYLLPWKTGSINRLIEEAVIKADQKGCKVLTLGLLNQMREELNGHGELYVHRNPHLKVRMVDGSSLAVAVVLNSIPKDTTQIVLRGKLNKVAYAIFNSLCQRGVKVSVLHEEEYMKLNVVNKFQTNLMLSEGYSNKEVVNLMQIWVVGDGLTDEEQLKAPKGTIFIPFSQFPPKMLRKDCFYHCTPAMKAPLSIENLHSCENWLGRRVMSTGRIAGIVHAMEGWEEHECGSTISNIDKVWEATLKHGFLPLNHTYCC